MKKQILLVVSSMAFACLSVFAQTTKEEMFEDLNRTGSVYYAYPITESLNTKAPKGYTPFYISHYGRHGSRFLNNYEDYVPAYKALQAAEKANALTEVGKDLLTRMHEICAEAEGTTGELTPLGRRQHRGIAERMYKAFPEVFENHDSISARASTVHRCGMSMMAFCDRLKEIDPKLKIYGEMDKRYMSYIINNTPEAQEFMRHSTAPWYEEYRKFKDAHIPTDRLINLIFSDKDFVKKQVNPKEFVWCLYMISCDLQDMETKVTLYDIFEKEELFDLWQCLNARFHFMMGNAKEGKGVVPAKGKNLLRNILETADKEIAHQTVAATLRFGHDTGITPLISLMEVNNCAAQTPTMEDTYKYWADYKISPMGANIQFIFFNKKNGGVDDILVKVLYNEREAKLPVKTDCFPFYKWTDFREFYYEKVK